MRVLVDTNILISAALNSNGTPYKAFMKAVTYPNKGIICDQNIEELRRIFNRKFPQKISLLEHFLSIALLAMEVAIAAIILSFYNRTTSKVDDFLNDRAAGKNIIGKCLHRVRRV